MTYSLSSASIPTISGQEILAIVDQLLPEDHPGGRLSDMQSIVLCHTWEDRSYQQIADDFGYQVDYIRQIASHLWRILSEAIGEKVSKKNLRSVLRRYQLSHPIIIYDTEIDRQVGIQDWGEAIDVSIFYGRHSETTKLEQWIAWNHCRLVSIYGLGGIGKTAFAIKLAQKLESQFEYIIWRSLRLAPAPVVLIADILTRLQGEPELSTDLTLLMPRLMQQLQQKRCLLILDNVDTMLQAGNLVGQFLPGYEAYYQLFNLIATVNHQSCLLLTSREQPQGLEQWDGDYLPVRSITLEGLSDSAGQHILSDKGWVAHGLEQDTLINHFGGNPLLLKMAITKIQNLFGGDLSQFLTAGHTVISDIWDLFDRQFQRLSPLQCSVMYWLAINQGHCSVKILQSQTQAPLRQVFGALEALHQRSWLQSHQTGLTQQPAVVEYVTGRLMETMAQEIICGDLDYCHSHALMPMPIDHDISNRRSRSIFEKESRSIFGEETFSVFGEGSRNVSAPESPGMLHILIEHLLAAFGTKTNVARQLGTLLGKLPGADYQDLSHSTSNILHIYAYLDLDPDCIAMNVSQLLTHSTDVALVDLN